MEKIFLSQLLRSMPVPGAPRKGARDSMPQTHAQPYSSFLTKEQKSATKGLISCQYLLASRGLIWKCAGGAWHIVGVEKFSGESEYRV